MLSGKGVNMERLKKGLEKALIIGAKIIYGTAYMIVGAVMFAVVMTATMLFGKP